MVSRMRQKIMDPIDRICTHIDNAKTIQNQRIELRHNISQPVSYPLGTCFRLGHDGAQRFINVQSRIQRNVI